MRVIINDEERLLAFRRDAGGALAANDRPGLKVEASLFQIAKSNGVPEPTIHYVLGNEDGLGDGFIMEWLDGETLGARIARSPEFERIRTGLAYSCGQIIGRIHDIDLDCGGLFDQLKFVSTEQYVQQTWNTYKDLRTPQPMLDYTAHWLLQNIPDLDTPRLVHNDFRNGNIMVSPEHGVVAVLDWELAHKGDPIRDLGWICTNSWRFGVPELPVGGFGKREDLLAGYKESTGRTVSSEHLKFWEVFGSFWWGCSSLAMGATYRHGLNASIERPAIGRRTSECQMDCVNLLIPGSVYPPTSSHDSLSAELPSTSELLKSVRDFLREELMPDCVGRTKYLTRVASNSLEIVLREVELSEAVNSYQRPALEDLLGHSGDVRTLQEELTLAIRDGSLPISNEKLKAYLRQTISNQVAIDQPKYSGYRIALNHSAEA